MKTILNEIENLTTASLQNDKLRMHIKAGTHFILADEPVEMEAKVQPLTLMSCSPQAFQPAHRQHCKCI